MLALSDTPIADVLRIFSQEGVEVSFLVPTETGLKKAILDAIAPLRLYLSSNGIHDFDSQRQGTAHKVIVKAFYVGETSLTETKVSLYRPETKRGDPRIWCSKLPRHSAAGNLLTLIAFDGILYVINASDTKVLSTIHVLASPLNKLIKQVVFSQNSVSEELLDKMKEVAARGFIETITQGDTGVGMTLEHALGIAANSSKAPDYCGIEIKASRRKNGRSNNRVNLYSQVPDWKLSPLNRGKDILDIYGYLNDEGRKQLYCTVDALKPNPQGLYFEVDEKMDWLKNKGNKDGLIKDVAIWPLPKLRSRLAEKHPETFWVKADYKVENGSEHFQYTNVYHTKDPLIANLEYLIADGTVTMDYTLSLKDSGVVRDHGYLFKVKPDNLDLLFPPGKEYNLLT